VRKQVRVDCDMHANQYLTLGFNEGYNLSRLTET
jgi:hypothetical protein